MNIINTVVDTGYHIAIEPSTMANAPTSTARHRDLFATNIPLIFSNPPTIKITIVSCVVFNNGWTTLEHELLIYLVLNSPSYFEGNLRLRTSYRHIAGAGPILYEPTNSSLQDMYLKNISCLQPDFLSFESCKNVKQPVIC